MIGSQDLLVGLLLQESTRSRMDALSPLRRCRTVVRFWSQAASAMTNNQASAARDKSARQRNGHHHRGEQDHLDVDVLNPRAVKRQERRPEPPR